MGVEPPHKDTILLVPGSHLWCHKGDDPEELHFAEYPIRLLRKAPHVGGSRNTVFLGQTTFHARHYGREGKHDPFDRHVPSHFRAGPLSAACLKSWLPQRKVVPGRRRKTPVQPVVPLTALQPAPRSASPTPPVQKKSKLTKQPAAPPDEKKSKKKVGKRQRDWTWIERAYAEDEVPGIDPPHDGTILLVPARICGAISTTIRTSRASTSRDIRCACSGRRRTLAAHRTASSADRRSSTPPVPAGKARPILMSVQLSVTLNAISFPMRVSRWRFTRRR